MSPLPTHMQAISFDRFGPSEVLQLTDWPLPTPGPRQLLIQVHAASINPRDWLIRSGRYFARSLLPKLPFILGSDVAGIVVGVGSQVSNFAVGDRVFAMQPSSDGFGGYAQYIAVRAAAVAPMPVRMSFEDAAAIPLAGLTALQALRDDARLQPGQKVVIVGASGGVGHYAVQIARAMGAKVTAVCSGRNTDFVSQLGAQQVIDYQQQSFLEILRGFDVVFDAFGLEGLARCRPVLNPRGTYVTTVPNAAHAKASLRSRLWPWGARSRIVLVRSNSSDLRQLATWAEQGQLKSELDLIVPLADARQAHDHSRSMRTRGKNVLRVTPPTTDPNDSSATL